MKGTEILEEDILRLIPHRPPFLWVDSILSQSDDRIETEKSIDPDLDIFQGHYPDYPIMPGVLLCEAVFQTGAILIARHMNKENNGEGNVPVLTRILEAKFKREVKPGDTIRMQAKVTGREGPAWFFKGMVTVNDKTAVKVKFVCALTGKK